MKSRKPTLYEQRMLAARNIDNEAHNVELSINESLAKIAKISESLEKENETLRRLKEELTNLKKRSSELKSV